ncbi:MAG TPA: glycosyltransferase family 9 protein [Candidatus Baltobacteraceae bacterium]
MAADSPSVLLVRLDAIGDALTLVPVIAALRRDGYRIGAILRPHNAAVFSRRALDRVYVAQSVSQSALADHVRADAYGAALIATEKAQGYRLARRARIPVRIGFENGWGKPLKTMWVRRMCTSTRFRTAGLDPRAPHECDVVFSLASPLVHDRHPVRDARVLRPYVIDEEPQPDERIAFQVTDKWVRLGASLEETAGLSQRLKTAHPMRFIGSRAEAPFVEMFAQAAGTRVEIFDALEPWKNAIAAARAIVAPDSGAAHVAGIVGTPVVSCFADAHFALQTRRWAPWAAPHRVVRIEPPWPLAAADALEDLLSGSPQFSYTG